METEQTYTVDRFEGDYAVCENRQTNETVNIEKEKLPENVEEGSVIKFRNNKYELDEDIQNEIEQRIKQKMDNLWKN